MAVKEKEKEREITFELEEHIGIIGTSQNGWKKELNMVAWNGGASKFDIRDWDEEHKHMGRGVTMNKEEAKTLAELLLALELK